MAEGRDGRTSSALAGTDVVDTCPTSSGWIVELWIPKRCITFLIFLDTSMKSSLFLTITCTEATVLDSERDHTCSSVGQSRSASEIGRTVHVENARYRGNGGADNLERYRRGNSLKEHERGRFDWNRLGKVCAWSHRQRTERKSAREDDAGDDEGDGRVGVVLPRVICEPDDEPCADDTDVPELRGISDGVPSRARRTASPSTCRNTPRMFIDPCECPLASSAWSWSSAPWSWPA